METSWRTRDVVSLELRPGDADESRSCKAPPGGKQGWEPPVPQGWGPKSSQLASLSLLPRMALECLKLPLTQIIFIKPLAVKNILSRKDNSSRYFLSLYPNLSISFKNENRLLHELQGL